MEVPCPRLDDPIGYVEKSTEMIRHNDLAEIMVGRMHAPCCGGVLRLVLQGRQLAESDVRFNDVLVSIRGRIFAQRQVPLSPRFSQLRIR